MPNLNSKRTNQNVAIIGGFRQDPITGLIVRDEPIEPSWFIVDKEDEGVASSVHNSYEEAREAQIKRGLAFTTKIVEW